MIGNTASAMEQIAEKVVAWAVSRPDVRAVLVLGSRARATDRPADEFSDLDLLVIADDPRRYQHTTDWLTDIGTPIVTFLEGNIAGEAERRVLFDGALDVDFNFFRTRLFRALNVFVWARTRVPWLLRLIPGRLRREIAAKVETLAGVAGRGYRILLDKSGVLRSLPALAAMAATAPPRPLPTEAAFHNEISDFWYHALWAARKLRRGELLVAKHCIDGYMKSLLVSTVRTLALVTHGLDYDTWHEYRFFEQWADAETVAALGRIYAHYDAADIARALRETMAVYGRVAREACERLGYGYPEAEEERVMAWVEGCLTGMAEPTEQDG